MLESRRLCRPTSLWRHRLSTSLFTPGVVDIISRTAGRARVVVIATLSRRRTTTRDCFVRIERFRSLRSFSLSSWLYGECSRLYGELILLRIHRVLAVLFIERLAVETSRDWPSCIFTCRAARNFVKQIYAVTANCFNFSVFVKLCIVCCHIFLCVHLLFKFISFVC